jgi:hypothetical protein
MGADRQQNHGEFMSGLLPANHTAPLNSAGERSPRHGEGRKFKSCEAHHFAVAAVCNHTARSNFVVVHESGFWHIATFRCDASIRLVLEA